MLIICCRLLAGSLLLVSGVNGYNPLVFVHDVCRVQQAIKLLHLLLPASSFLLFLLDSTTSDSLKSKVSQRTSQLPHQLQSR